MHVRAYLGGAFLISLSTFGSITADAEDWKITGTDLVRYSTHGQIVHGHKFGFVKPPGRCDTDVLWLSWSSYNPEALSANGADAFFAADVDGTQFKIGVRARKAGKLTPILFVVAFSDFIAGPKLIELLKSSTEIKLTIDGPDSIAKLFDIKSDVFSLDGFEPSRQRATQFCKLAKLDRKL